MATASDDAALPVAMPIPLLLRFRTADYAELTVCVPPSAGRRACHLLVHPRLTVTQLRHLQAAFARLSLPSALAPEEIAALIARVLPGVRPVTGNEGQRAKDEGQSY